MADAAGRMITFDRGQERFVYRAAGIILRGDEVLLQRIGDQDFWCLPGGRIELGEAAERGLKRELREELGFDARVGRLVWVLENFFEYDGIHYHESGLYFLAMLPGNCELLGCDSFATKEADGTALLNQWHRLDALEGIGLLPGFLQHALRAIPDGTQYVVHHDGAK